MSLTQVARPEPAHPAPLSSHTSHHVPGVCTAGALYSVLYRGILVTPHSQYLRGEEIGCRGRKRPAQGPAAPVRNGVRHLLTPLSHLRRGPEAAWSHAKVREAVTHKGPRDSSSLGRCEISGDSARNSIMWKRIQRTMQIWEKKEAPVE